MAEGSLKLVLVTWLDAYSNDDEWTDVDKVEIEEHVCRTVGWLVKESDRYYLVAATIGEGRDKRKEAGQKWGIPKGMVIDFTVLEEGKRL